MSKAGQPQAPSGIGRVVASQPPNSLGLERCERGVMTLILRQAGRPVVILDWELLRAIDAALDTVSQTSGVTGFVLASDSRVFIAGANLQEIMNLSDAELHDYLRFGQKVYSRIATMPFTTVAAINGAALGGGLEIAMHCDLLVGAEPTSSDPEKPVRPYHVGLPEAGLSICPGWGGTNLFPARVEPGLGIELTATGRTLPVTEACEAGLLEQLVAPDDLLERARDLAFRPKAGPRMQPVCISDAARADAARAALKSVKTKLPGTQAAAAVVECVEAGLAGGWQAALDRERECLVRLRNSDEGREAIKKFFEKTAPK